MAAAHPDAASDMELNLDMNTSHQPGSTHTPQNTAPQNIHTQSNQPFLPGNGPIHLAPSLTHQPELLLLSRLFDILFVLVTHILEHPMADGPLPDPTMFVDDNAFRLFHQYHSSVVELGRATINAPDASSQIAPMSTRPSFYLANTAWIPQRTSHHTPLTFSPHHPPLTVPSTISQPFQLSLLNNHHNPQRTLTLTRSIYILNTQLISRRLSTSTPYAMRLIKTRVRITGGSEAQTSSHPSQIFCSADQNSYRNFPFLPFLLFFSH